MPTKSFQEIWSLFINFQYVACTKEKVQSNSAGQIVISSGIVVVIVVAVVIIIIILLSV